MNSTMSKAIESVSEAIISDAVQVFPEAASDGDFVRQGDVYITRLGAVPTGCMLIKKPSQQLAPGNTQGSRHCVSSLRGMKLYSLPNPTAYDGPVIEAKREFTIEHPEHGDWKCQPGIYGISYQRTEDSEGRQRRVQD